MKAEALKSWPINSVLGTLAAALLLTGCGPTRLNVKASIPPLLMTPMPLSMGVRIPKSFAEYVQKEKSQEREWVITLGPGQADAIRSVTAAMFEHTVMLGDQAPGDAEAIATHKLNAILETTLDSYVYLLPSPGGASEFYSATIGYKVNLHAVDGTLLGSWVYEGYGSTPARGISDSKGVALVTGLAIRDACANIAAHLPDQELVRNLLSPPVAAPTAPSEPPAAPAGGESNAAPGPAQQPSPVAAPPLTTPGVTPKPEESSPPTTVEEPPATGTGS